MKYIIILALFLACHTTSAIDLDVGIGYTMTKDPKNGYWYQKGFDNSIDSDSPSAHIGLRFHTTDNLDLIIGYKYIGEFSSDAMASSSDLNYKEWQNGEAEIWPLARWEGAGKVHGLYGTAEYNFKHFFVTAGGFYHVSTWKMKITDWRCATRNNRCTADYSQATYGEPINKTVKAEEKYQLGYTFGIGKKFGPVSVAYETTSIKRAGKYAPIYAGRAHTISLTHTF